MGNFVSIPLRQLSADHSPIPQRPIIFCRQSLGMIMGLCLLVYTLAQRHIRNALLESKSTIKNQLGKATNRPTLRWIFQCFQCIHLVTLNQEKHISNWNKDRDFILSLLPATLMVFSISPGLKVRRPLLLV